MLLGVELEMLILKTGPLLEIEILLKLPKNVEGL